MKKWHARDHRGEFLCGCESDENDYLSRTWQGVNCEECLKLRPTVESVTAKISEFTKEKNESDGGYAPVKKGEMSDLYSIIKDILLMKYEEDCDGDLPVEVDLVDRNKCHRNNFRPIPYSINVEVDSEEEMDILYLLQSNLSMAARDLNQFIDGMAMERKYRKETS